MDKYKVHRRLKLKVLQLE